MFEARLLQGQTFKNVVDAVKDLVTDANLECTDEEISMQCMDSAHVSLVAINLTHNAFDQFRCDRNLNLGFNSANMAKVLKMMGKDDQLVLKAEDDGDKLIMMFENEKTGTIADFELKLMEINADQLGVPDTPYKCTVKMPSDEFQRIMRDLQVLGDTCKISVTKEGIRFTVSGAIGTGNILLRANTSSDKEEENVVIDMEEPVELNFALRYLNFFSKATPLSKSVIICMSPDLPVVVEYPIEDIGYVKYYLAPKVDEEGEEEEE